MEPLKVHWSAVKRSLLLEAFCGAHVYLFLFTFHLFLLEQIDSPKTLVITVWLKCKWLWLASGACYAILGSFEGRVLVLVVVILSMTFHWFYVYSGTVIPRGPRGCYSHGRFREVETSPPTTRFATV